jgi:hypothetical protein
MELESARLDMAQWSILSLKELALDVVQHPSMRCMLVVMGKGGLKIAAKSWNI